MILLGHERQCFSRTNKRLARRRPPASLRRTVSDRDLAYLIRTLLRFSMQQERGLSSPTAQFARILPAAGCHRRIGCTPCREGSGRPPSDVPRQRHRGKVHPRDEQEAVSQLPCQRQDGTAVGRGSSLSSHLTQTTQICFEAHRPPLRVRLLVSRCGGRRSSGDTHGPCLRLPLHCQACQRSLTRKRSLVQIQYRPPVFGLARSTFSEVLGPACD
jgi:hypothetical protein